MIRTTSLFRTSLVSLTLIAGAALAGCTDAGEPATHDVESAVIGQPASTAIASGAQLRLSGTTTSLTGEGWTQREPGIFTPAAGRGANAVIVGAEGHARAIANTEAKLADLRANGGSSDDIRQQEAFLGQLKTAASTLAANAVSPRATCDIAIGTIPSSLLVAGFVGIFAGAQLSCSVDTQVFTVQSQACTDLGCGPINVQTTGAVGATPELWGSITQGTAGAACSGAVLVIPPGFSGPVTGTCG